MNQVEDNVDAVHDLIEIVRGVLGAEIRLGRLDLIEPIETFQ